MMKLEESKKTIQHETIPRILDQDTSKNRYPRHDRNVEDCGHDRLSRLDNHLLTHASISANRWFHSYIIHIKRDRLLLFRIF